MQSIEYFSDEDIESFFDTQHRSDADIKPVSGICPVTGLEVTLTYSHFNGAFTIKIEPPDGKTIEIDLGDTADADDFTGRANSVNQTVNLLIGGIINQQQKLDAVTAAWAVNDEAKEAGFMQDFGRFERLFLFEGFDRDVAQKLAFSTANTKWCMFDGDSNPALEVGKQIAALKL